MSNVAGSSYGPLMESVSLRLAERYGFDYGRVRLWNSSVFAATNFLSGLAISQWGMIVLAPWRALTAAERWNGYAPQSAMGVARTSSVQGAQPR